MVKSFFKTSLKLFYFYLFISIFFLFTAQVVLALTESDNYIIWADVFSAGGLESDSSANYGLQDSIGEAIVFSDDDSSANYGLTSGFRELYPDQYVTLSVGAGSVSFGNLSSSSVKTASHTLTVATNAAKGFIASVSGTTLISGGDDIDAIGSTAAASAVGTEQFGLNVVANSSPSVGAAPSGVSPIGNPAGQYSIANSFAFQSGNAVAFSSAPINQTVFTVSYIANIASGTATGNYSTTLTYSVTANY